MNTPLVLNNKEIVLVTEIDAIKNQYEVFKWNIGENLAITKHDVRLALLDLSIKNIENHLDNERESFKISLVLIGLTELIHSIDKDNRCFKPNRVDEIIELLRDKMNDMVNDYFNGMISETSKFLIYGENIMSTEEMRDIKRAKKILIDIVGAINLYHDSDKEIEKACIIYSMENKLAYLEAKYNRKIKERWRA